MIYTQKDKKVLAVQVNDSAIEHYTRSNTDQAPEVVGYFREFGMHSCSKIKIVWEEFSKHTLRISSVIVHETPDSNTVALPGDYIIHDVYAGTLNFKVVSEKVFLSEYSPMEAKDFITDTFDFGKAIDHLKEGRLVTRKGWNGKKMFLFLRPGLSLNQDAFFAALTVPPQVKRYYERLFNGETHFSSGKPIEITFTGYICMKAADETIVNGWLASQTDMLSTDWCIFEL